MPWTRRARYAREITVKGITYRSIRQAALAHGFNPEMITHRLRRMPIEQAFSTPLRITEPGGQRKKRPRRTLVLREALRRYKEQHSCKDCGGRFIAEVMEFDHTRGQKKFSICEKGGDVSLATLKAEIAKCDLVCANCHRIRTYRRRVGSAV